MSDNYNDFEENDENYVKLIEKVINFSLNFDTKDIKYLFPRLMDSRGLPLVLQPSLFPMVWPTIYFVLEDESMSSVPNKLKPYLRWKLSSITANTMKAIVIKSGFRLLKDNNKKSYRNWSAIWCKHMKCIDFMSIKDYQKVNHFPGSFHFGRKDKLWLNLRSMAIKHGFEVFGDFHPQTFVLPQDLNHLKKFWISSDEDLVFILKPPASARGQGITIINNYKEIPKGCRNKVKANSKTTLVVQRYITNPCLLYNETKFDLRVYVLITSIVPLRVYVYDDGLVRFASHKYSNDIKNNCDNQFMHLTNYSVNKKNMNYVPNNDIDGQNGNKWTLKTLWRYLSHSCKEVDIDLICNSIEDMIIKTIISCEPFVSKLMKQNIRSRYSCFELLGFDVMLDSSYKPWLIEVNISPSLRSDSSLDSAVKSGLIKDMLNIVGHQIPPNFKSTESFAQFICYNRNYFFPNLTEEEMTKHRKYERDFANSDDTEDITNELTDEDIRYIIESEDELSRSGSFKRVFPSHKSNHYLKYFDQISYLNVLLDEWEQQFHNNREKGIQRIRGLIWSKRHLFYNNSDEIMKTFLCNYEMSETFEDNDVIDK